MLFRSEEAVDAWCRMRDIPRGATILLETGMRLAQAWYHDRLSPTWRRRTPEKPQALFTSLGLTGSNWDLG